MPSLPETERKKNTPQLRLGGARDCSPPPSMPSGRRAKRRRTFERTRSGRAKSGLSASQVSVTAHLHFRQGSRPSLVTHERCLSSAANLSKPTGRTADHL